MPGFRRGLSISIFSLAVLVAGAREAAADVVAPPTDGVCPPGTQPGNSHGLAPAYCAVLDCTTDADCPDGLVCGQQPLCADGYWAISSCPEGTCEYFDCQTLSVCVEGGGGEASDGGGASEGGSDEGSGTPKGRGCGCSVDDEGVLGLSALVLLVAGLGLRRRSWPR